MKKLQELSQEEYQTLKNMGFLWELYPEATGCYEKDTLKEDLSVDLIQMRLVSWNSATEEENIKEGFAMNYDLQPSVNKLVELFFDFYRELGFLNSLEVKIKNQYMGDEILYCDIE